MCPCKVHRLNPQTVDQCTLTSRTFMFVSRGSPENNFSLCSFCSLVSVNYSPCSLYRPPAAVKTLRGILERFTGLSNTARNECVAFLPLLHYVHLSSKPDTSALKQVLVVGGGVAMATKSPSGLGHLLRFSFLLLWRDENSRGQTVRATLL